MENKVYYGIVSDDGFNGIELTDLKEIEGSKVSTKLISHLPYNPFKDKQQFVYIQSIDGDNKYEHLFYKGETIYFGKPKNHCHFCNGTGKQKIQVESNGKTTETEIECVYCDGKTLTEWQAKKIKDEVDEQNKLWCTCGNPSKRAHYVDDTPEMKHHWLCDDCGKIYQIG